MSDPGLYNWLMRMLTCTDSSCQEPESGWQDVLEHKLWMSRTLQHDVPTVVALLDRFLSPQGDSDEQGLTETAFLNRLSRSLLLDELTQLYNRRFFNDLLRRELKRTQRHSLNLSLLILDLDDFKKCNDKFGHTFGDRVLSYLGALLRNTVREFDLPCRYGGEEFAIILPQTPSEAASVVAERVRRAVEQARFPIDGSQCAFSLTASGGLSSFGHKSASPDELVAAADLALYKAKSEGKNRICFLHSSRVKIERKEFDICTKRD